MASNPQHAQVQRLRPNISAVKLKPQQYPAPGTIYVMYHGTNFTAAVSIIQHGFRQSSDGMLGKGVYVTRDKDKAFSYPLNNKTDQVILKLTVKVGRVKRIDAQRVHLAKTWHDHGYNTAWVPPNSGIVTRGLEEDCVWNPRRIRVAGISHTANPQHMQYLTDLLAQHKH